MKSIVIILDPAHGADVKGKCSPDGKHKEYLWSRNRVSSLRRKLIRLGYEVYVTTDSVFEPGLSVRQKFATQIAKGKKKLLLSLHNNAAGNGTSWTTANGVEVYTTPGVTEADRCADTIITTFKEDFPELRMRCNKDTYLERDKEAKFTVLMGSGYMGVLVEWLFQDNKEEANMLMDTHMNERFEASIIKAVEKLDTSFKK